MAKKSGWKSQSKRHSNAKKFGRAGGIYSKPRKRFNTPKSSITAPLSKRSTKLPIQFSVVVPSTVDENKKISAEAFRKRIEATANEFSNRFGGDTAIRGKGDFTKDGELIREDVVIVETSMTEKQYEDNKAEIEKFIVTKKEEWKQDSIGFGFEDDFYIFPNELSAKQEEQLKVHAQHHTPKHLKIMRAEMQKGESFSEAHKTALKSAP